MPMGDGADAKVDDPGGNGTSAIQQVPAVAAEEAEAISQAREAARQLKLAQDMMAKAHLRVATASEERAAAQLRARQAEQDILAGQQRAAEAAKRSQEAELQLAQVAANLRLPQAKLASVVLGMEPLPPSSLPSSIPGQLRDGSVAAVLHQHGTSAFSSDSGSWDPASRQASADSGWDSNPPLGTQQGSWEWFGSRGSGSLALNSFRRASEDAFSQEYHHSTPAAPGTPDSPSQLDAGSGPSGSLLPPARRASGSGLPAHPGEVRRRSFIARQPLGASLLQQRYLSELEPPPEHEVCDAPQQTVSEQASESTAAGGDGGVPDGGGSCAVVGGIVELR